MARDAIDVNEARVPVSKAAFFCGLFLGEIIKMPNSRIFKFSGRANLDAFYIPPFKYNSLPRHRDTHSMASEPSFTDFSDSFIDAVASDLYAVSNLSVSCRYWSS